MVLPHSEESLNMEYPDMGSLSNSNSVVIISLTDSAIFFSSSDCIFYTSEWMIL